MVLNGCQVRLGITLIHINYTPTDEYRYFKLFTFNKIL